MRLQEIMSTRIVTVDPDEAADIAWSRMQREGIRHLIVTEADERRTRHDIASGGQPDARAADRLTACPEGWQDRGYRHRDRCA